MNSERQILDTFGKILIEECFDPTYANLEGLRNRQDPPIIFKDYVDLFNKLDESDFGTLQSYFKESLGDILFNFLRLFEEKENFKIYYEGNGKKINLVEISEMLKAEPIIQNGWIERFSKVANNNS